MYHSLRVQMPNPIRLPSASQYSDRSAACLVSICRAPTHQRPESELGLFHLQPAFDLFISRNRRPAFARQAIRSTTRRAVAFNFVHQIHQAPSPLAWQRGKRPSCYACSSASRSAAHTYRDPAVSQNIRINLISGPTTKRISPYFGCTSPVAMHLRLDRSRVFGGATARHLETRGLTIRPRLPLSVFARRLRLRLPSSAGSTQPSIHAGRHDHVCASSKRHVERFQHTVIFDALAFDCGPATGQFPIRTGCKIFQRFHAIFGQGLQHLWVSDLQIQQAVLDAQRTGRFQAALFCASSTSRARACNSLSCVFINAVDHQQVRQLQRRRLLQGW